MSLFGGGHVTLPLPNALGLELARPHVPPGLIEADRWGALLDTARCVPDGFGTGCIEVRLDDDPQVDLLWCANVHDRTTLASEVARSGLGALEGVAGLVEAWCDPASPLWSMPLLWVEIDHADGERSRAFAHIRVAPYEIGAEWVPRPLDETWPMVQAGLNRMRAGLGYGDDARAAHRAIRLAPKRSVLMHVNCPASRGSREVRFELAMPVSEVGDYLERIGYRHVARAQMVAQWLTSIDVKRCQLIVSMLDGVPMDRISFEPLVDSERYADHYAEVFQLAAQQTTALNAKTDALASWIGVHDIEHPNLAWPALLACGFDFKFVVDTSGFSCKAYLVYHPSLSAVGGFVR